MMRKVFSLLILICFTFLMSSSTAVGWSSSPLIINGEINPREITTTGSVVVTVKLTNVGDLPVKGINVQVIPPGFKIISEKKWPDNIYPNSFIIGQYILQPYDTGIHPISVSATYTINNTAISPPEIKQRVSILELGDAEVHWDLSWPSAWNLTSTTLLGTFIGFVITKVSDYLTSKRIESRERKEKIEKAK